MVRSLAAALMLVLLAPLSVCGGSTSILARPAAGARGSHRGLKQSKVNAGFIVQEVKQQQQPQEHKEGEENAPAPPSFVSLGIRSSCARKKAATLYTKRSSESAATRLRGGGNFGQPPVVLMRHDMNPSPDMRSAASHEFHHCSERTSSSGQLVTAKQKLVKDEPREPSFSEEEHDNRRLNMGAAASAGGGGGGGGHAGTMPYFPRTMPPAKAPLNKKFAWVP